MPSPVAHALAGLAGGWIVRSNRVVSARASGMREAALFASLGMLADADLLFGVHREATHSLGATAVAALAAWLPGVRPATVRERWVLALACAVAYGSHTLLDWLGSDSSAPFGVMALWPFSRRYHESTLHVFLAISRRIRQPELFWAQNLAAFRRELAILLPIVALVGWFRRSRNSTLGVAQHPKHHGEQRERHGG